MLCQLRKELAAERSSSQRAKIEHEAQLVSLRRGRDELEKVLKSHQVHMQMERQARQEMHLKTLKVSARSNVTSFGQLALLFLGMQIFTSMILSLNVYQTTWLSFVDGHCFMWQLWHESDKEQRLYAVTKIAISWEAVGNVSSPLFSISRSPHKHSQIFSN